MSDYQSFDGHGVDVVVNRVDDLDKKALAYVNSNPGCRALDLGSGAGGQSVRMAIAGACVTAVDQYDFTDAFAVLRAGHSLSPAQLQFIPGNISQLDAVLVGQMFDIVLFQRTLHYLTYSDASSLLSYLHTITRDKLFISVTGVGSLVGEEYLCADQPIADRFCELSSLGKEKFLIHEPVCLYTEHEFTQILVESGWIVADCSVSAFGNIKAVCTKL